MKNMHTLDKDILVQFLTNADDRLYHDREYLSPA
ncbi:hypothetical protein BH18THE1_BH18THE1_12920 [soil metagenome]